MCFSNLPIEFDEEGNPYLAEEADEVDAVPEQGCGCGAQAEEVPLEEADPEAMAEDILAAVSGPVGDRHADGVEEGSSPDHRNSAEGD